MKYAFACLLLTSLVFGQSASGPSPEGANSGTAIHESASQSSIPTEPENVKKARAVLDQAVQALGGEAYLNVQDMIQEGRSYSFHHGRSTGVGVTFTRTRKSWDKDRVDYTASHEIDVDLIFGIEVPMGSSKTHVTLIYNGDEGYEITNKGVRDLEKKDELEPYLRRRRYTLELVLRRWMSEPGVALFYEGQTVAAQKEADQVTIMNPKNEAVTLYFDINTHLPVRKTFSWRDPTDKERNVEEEIFDDYRKIQGIMTPFDVTRVFNGDMAAQYFLNSTIYNRGVSDGVFDPKAEPPGKRH